PDVGGDRLVEGEALRLAVLGDEGESGTDGVARAARVDHLAAHGDLAGDEALDSEDPVGDLGPAAALEARERDDLARADVEVDAADHAVTGAAHAQPDVADGRALALG